MFVLKDYQRAGLEVLSGFLRNARMRGVKARSRRAATATAASRSATAVEQLLDRVLRMPYARRRAREALNKAFLPPSATTHRARYLATL